MLTKILLSGGDPILQQEEEQLITWFPPTSVQKGMHLLHRQAEHPPQLPPVDKPTNTTPKLS